MRCFSAWLLVWLGLFTGNAQAEVAISDFKAWDSELIVESIAGSGDFATKTGESGSASSMAKNPALYGSAWAHQADFFQLHVSDAPSLKVRVNSGNPDTFAPGLSIWAIGAAAAFDGGTQSFGDEVSEAGFGTPHSFNAYGALGDAGTLWMQDGQGGNAKELLGYAISGASYLGDTGWSETITTGAHDKSVSDSYEMGVSGSTGVGYVELIIEAPADGYYLIYVGGTDHSLAGGTFDLIASAVADSTGGAITDFKAWDSELIVESVVGAGDFATKTGESGGASSMANNPALYGSAWAHQADFFQLHVSDAPRLKVRVNSGNPDTFAPGLSVWAIGDEAAFDGGTQSFGGETSEAGFGTPHSFNAYGPLGDDGTLWMQDGWGGNAKELLGYAISGASYLDDTGWSETITTGAHDMSVSNAYETGVSGGVGAGYAELLIDAPADGYYLIYVGGTDHSLAGGTFDLAVTALPEPATCWLQLTAVLALISYRRLHGR